jgi:predicted RNA binding protein YcfA (HicA-like mRNA interferase family)
VANGFPALKARRLRAVLERKPLSYRVVRQSGSHKRMKSRSYPPFTFSVHDGSTVSPVLVRKVLIEDVGLAEAEAMRLL